MGSIALTAPEAWGFLAGSTLYGGIVNGFNGNQSGVDALADSRGNQINYYAGATVATPVTGLRLGAAFDYLLNVWGSKCSATRTILSPAMPPTKPPRSSVSMSRRVLEGHPRDRSV